MGDEKPGAVRFLTDFSAGSRIAGYRLEEQIGHGGTAGAAKEFRGMLPYLSRRLGPDHPHTRAAAEHVGRTR
jgi:hypothetical protein